MTNHTVYNEFVRKLEEFFNRNNLVEDWNEPGDGVYGVKLTDGTPVSLGVNITP